MNFTGQIDNVQVFGVRPTTVLVNEFAHHTQSPDDPHVLYNALCDEGRGDVFLDEKQMLSGRFVFTNDMDWVAKGYVLMEMCACVPVSNVDWCVV